MKRLLFFAFLFCAVSAWAQNVPPGAGDSKAATGGARPGQMNEGFIGRDVPHFDPGSDTMAYDGKLWNINDNRLFRARFEKYLNAAAATSAADVSYRATIEQIMDLLTPGKATKANQDAAFALLKKASQYKDDANLCTTLSDAIYSAQNTLAEVEKLKRDNAIWEKQRSQAEWNNEVAAGGSFLAPKVAKDDAFGQENQKLARDARVATDLGRARGDPQRLVVVLQQSRVDLHFIPLALSVTA